jgi:hypothetical protein
LKRQDRKKGAGKLLKPLWEKGITVAISKNLLFSSFVTGMIIQPTKLTPGHNEVMIRVVFE